MAYPADYTDSDDSDKDSWDFDDFEPESEHSPEDDYYVWRRPNTYTLVPKFQQLIRDYPGGLWLEDLPDAYFKKYHEHLDWTIFGYKTLKDLIMDYSDVLEIIREGTGPDGWLVIDATRPPTEEEKTAFSMRLNNALVVEFARNIGRAVQFFISYQDSDFTLGLPVGCLQSVYEELYGCLVRYEVLGFESLVSFCLAIDGDGFNVCKIDETYVLLPPLKPWFSSDLDEIRPILLDIDEDLYSFPKDFVGPYAMLYELNHKLYLKPGEITKIVVTSYNDPMDFHFILEGFRATLLEFQTGLLKFYSHNTDYKMPRRYIRPGQLCVVSHWIAQRVEPVFDRGRILELFSGDQVSVKLIDLGRKITVSRNVVRYLHKQFASFPIHSLPAKLAGIIPRSTILNETMKTKMECYVTQPYLEAELHCPDFHKPLFPMIVYPRYSQKSINRMLLESGQYRLTPSFPYSILTRKIHEIEPKYRLSPTEPECSDSRSSGRAPESEPLLSENSDSEDEIYESKSIKMDYLSGIKGDSYIERTSSPTLPPSATTKERPAVSQHRPRPVISQPKSSPTLGLIRSPLTTPLDVSMLKSNMSDSLILKPIHIPRLTGLLARENEERKGKEKSNSGKQKGAENELLENNAQQDPVWKFPKIRHRLEDDGRFQGKLCTSSNMARPTGVFERILRSSLFKALPEEAFDYFRRVWYQNKLTNESPDDDSCTLEDEETYTLNLDPNSNLKEISDDEDKYLLYLPDHPIVFEIVGTDFDESSESSETVSECEDSCSESAQWSKNEDANHSKLFDEMEMHMLVMRFLTSNPIIREVAVQEPQFAFNISKEWAEYAMLTKDSSPPDPVLFDPFIMCPNKQPEQAPSKLRSLIEILPKNIYEKYFNLARASRSRSPVKSSSSQNCDYQLFAAEAKLPLGVDDRKLQKIEGDDMHIFVKKLRKTNNGKTKKKRYEVTFSGKDGLECTESAIRVLDKIPNSKVIETLKKKSCVSITWDSKSKTVKTAFHQFRLFFVGYVVLEENLKTFGRNAKREFLGVKKR